MTEHVTISTASHTAYLDPMTGEGLLLLPDPGTDVRHPFAHGSAHEADWTVMVRRLDGLGWEPTADEDGSMLEAGTTADGLTVVGLYGLDPIKSMPSMEDQAQSGQALAALAGLAPL